MAATQGLARIRQNCRACAIVGDIAYIINPAYTVAWEVVGGAPPQPTDTTWTPEKLIPAIERANVGFDLPLKVIRTNLKMGRSYKRGGCVDGKVRYGPITHVPAAKYWQISFRPGKVVFLPFAQGGKALDFVAVLGMPDSIITKDFMLSHDLMKEVFREIPVRKENAMIRISMAADEHSIISIQYREGDRLVIAHMAPTVPDDGSYHILCGDTAQPVGSSSIEPTEDQSTTELQEVEPVSIEAPIREDPKLCPRGVVMATCLNQSCDDFCLGWERCAYLIPDLRYGD